MKEVLSHSMCPDSIMMEMSPPTLDVNLNHKGMVVDTSPLSSPQSPNPLDNDSLKRRSTGLSAFNEYVDLVKRHLMYAVREEVEILKQQIGELMDRIGQLEYENTFLKSEAQPETLNKLLTAQRAQPKTSQQPTQQINAAAGTSAAGQVQGQGQQQQQQSATQQPNPNAVPSNAAGQAGQQPQTNLNQQIPTNQQQNQVSNQQQQPQQSSQQQQSESAKDAQNGNHLSQPQQQQQQQQQQHNQTTTTTTTTPPTPTTTPTTPPQQQQQQQQQSQLSAS